MRLPIRHKSDSVRRRRSPQQDLRAQVLIDVWPMDVIFGTGVTSVEPLLGCRVEQPRIPRERHRNGAPIHQIDDQASFISPAGTTRSSAVLVKVAVPSLEQQRPVFADQSQRPV